MNKKAKRSLLISLALLCTTLIMSGSMLSMNHSRKYSISADGSTSMEKVIGILGEAFELEQDEIGFTFNPTGSTAGIEAVKSGRSEIGLSSRELSMEENQVLESQVIALDGIALIVNKENPVSDLSRSDIQKIYTQKITNWKEIGGEDVPIVLIGRESGSGTRDGFEQALDLSGLCSYRQELTSSGDIRNAVYSNPGAIGYVSFISLKDDIKALKVDHADPNEKNVRENSYPISRPFLLVTSKEIPLSKPAEEFIKYVLSDNAKPYIEQAGAIYPHAD